MKCDKKDLLFYAVTDRSWLGQEIESGQTAQDASSNPDSAHDVQKNTAPAYTTLASQVEAALEGGATFLQLREKHLSYEEFLKEAFQLRELCRRYHVPFVINDNVDIALASDADGVHVGQKDMAAGDVRAKLGPDKIIGVSAQTVEQALLAERMGADYLGVGAVFHTDSKADAADVSHETLRQICEAVQIPVIAIGGINADNVMELTGTGICGVAVISAIFAQKNISSAARNLKALTEKMVQA